MTVVGSVSSAQTPKFDAHAFGDADGLVEACGQERAGVVDNDARGLGIDPWDGGAASEVLELAF